MADHNLGRIVILYRMAQNYSIALRQSITRTTKIPLIQIIQIHVIRQNSNEKSLIIYDFIISTVEEFTIVHNFDCANDWLN